MKVRYSATASRELLDAVAFYEQRQPGLGVAFRVEVERIESLLLKFPASGRRMRGARRAVLLRRFPYRLIYSADEAGIRILAIAHQKRRPGYWRGRVEESAPDYLPWLLAG